jgi:hypothetical protein
MHPGLKRVEEGRISGPSQDLRSAAQETDAARNPNDLRPATKAPVEGHQSSIRKPITAEKFAYLRAQVHVFRRSR